MESIRPFPADERTQARLALHTNPCNTGPALGTSYEQWIGAQLRKMR